MASALILTTGWGSVADPFFKVGDISALQKLVITFQGAGIQQIVVVCGQNISALEKHLARMGVICIQAQGNTTEKMVQAGIGFLKQNNQGILLATVAVPLVTSKTVESLCNGQAKQVLAPFYKGQTGFPLYIPPRSFTVIEKATAFVQLQKIVKQAKQIDVQDEGSVLMVADTPAYHQWCANGIKQPMRPKIKLSIAREDTFHGPGTQQLLKLIQQTGSLRLACKQMGLSYTKGWKMIKEIEKQLGCPVVQTQTGGKAGGGSVLTPAGMNLTQQYELFYTECLTSIQSIFMKHFNDEQPIF